MLTKMAFFSGTIKQGKDAQMRAHVKSVLQPLWEQFQPSEKVQVWYGFEQEPNGPNIPLVLAVTYRDEAAMKLAMESQARHQAKALLPELYEQFFDEVNLWHYVFES